MEGRPILTMTTFEDNNIFGGFPDCFCGFEMSPFRQERVYEGIRCCKFLRVLVNDEANSAGWSAPAKSPPSIDILPTTPVADNEGDARERRCLRWLESEMRDNFLSGRGHVNSIDGQLSDRRPPKQSMSAATPTLIPRGGHFPALLPPVPSRGEPKPPTFRGRSDGRINMVRDLAKEMDDLSDEEAEIEGLVGRIVTNSFARTQEPNRFPE